MNTLRKAFGYCAVFLLLFLAACGGGAAATEEAPRELSSGEDYAAATEAPAPEQPASILPSGGYPAPTAGAGNEPYDMFFEDYGVNPSIDTEDDNLSTFALDVDTGSYTVMRNYLNDGNLPPPESVRVE